MKKYDRIFKIIPAVATLLLIAAVTGCTQNLVETSRGKLPDEEALDNVSGILRSVRSPHNRASIGLVEGNGQGADKIFCQLSQPAANAITATAAMDAELVEAYNAEYGTELVALPAANVVIDGGGSLTLAPGDRRSQAIGITFSAAGLAPGVYLAPITLTSASEEFAEENRTLYYGVRIRGLEVGDYELETEYMTVFYLNTMDYQPLLADIWLLEKMDYMTFEPIWVRTNGNIVNLRVVTIAAAEASGRAKLVLNSDMRYVLEHADKYIRPLQDKGRKVCLCLEGGGTGLGFCNLSDSQIDDFTEQVKTVIELYELDGVNLWDRNSGYGKEGMPAANTTSYPKLIKALREKLGSEKLITLTDHEEPTESFSDTGKTGGIAVGDYIDYAWSGYMSEDEDVQLVDPWLDPETAEMYGVILHEREPIAGITPERYGCFAIPMYARNSEYLQGNENWEVPGFESLGSWCYEPTIRKNKIVVFADLISNQQTEYEGSWADVPGIAWYMIGEGSLDGMVGYNCYVDTETTGLYYWEFAKDWE